jgi:hypothetical protein
MSRESLSFSESRPGASRASLSAPQKQGEANSCAAFFCSALSLPTALVRGLRLSVVAIAYGKRAKAAKIISVILSPYITTSSACNAGFFINQNRDQVAPALP